MPSMKNSRKCNSDCTFYKKIRDIGKDAAIGNCYIFAILVKENNNCHNEKKADEEEANIKNYEKSN